MKFLYFFILFHVFPYLKLVRVDIESKYVSYKEKEMKYIQIKFSYLILRNNEEFFCLLKV